MDVLDTETWAVRHWPSTQAPSPPPQPVPSSLAWGTQPSCGLQKLPVVHSPVAGQPAVRQACVLVLPSSLQKLLARPPSSHSSLKSTTPLLWVSRLRQVSE